MFKYIDMLCHICIKNTDTTKFDTLDLCNECLNRVNKVINENESYNLYANNLV